MNKKLDKLKSLIVMRRNKMQRAPVSISVDVEEHPVAVMDKPQEIIGDAPSDNKEELLVKSSAEREAPVKFSVADREPNEVISVEKQAIAVPQAETPSVVDGSADMPVDTSAVEVASDEQKPKRRRRNKENF